MMDRPVCPEMYRLGACELVVCVTYQREHVKVKCAHDSRSMACSCRVTDSEVLVARV